MCQAIKDLIADGEARGKALGEKHAREQGIQIFILDNLEENIPHDRIQMKLQRRYNLTSELATYYIKEYGVR